MQPDSPRHLEDIRAAAGYILEKTSGKTVEDYLSDDLLRPAVERHFESSLLCDTLTTVGYAIGKGPDG